MTRHDRKAEAKTLLEQGVSANGLATLLGVSRTTAKRIAKEIRDEEDPGFHVEDAEARDPELDADTLIARRKDEFARKEKEWKGRLKVPVKIKLDGPIGILHMGDPHVDDPGCNIGKLERDVKLVQDTEGLFGANVGDLQNNWIGRLSHLYKEQETTAAEAWVLVEWLVTSVPWLYLVGGNHDQWHLNAPKGPGDPIQWLMQQRTKNGAYEPHGVRLALQFPNGKEVRVNARHDFKGHSQWNTVHGPSKAAQMAWKDHILSCGHKHTSGYQPIPDPNTGLLSHVIRLGGYKEYDKYGFSEGLPNQNFSPSFVTVIDPKYADDDPRLVHVCLDAEEGAEFLKWKRRNVR